jgi:hypothetical protein
VADFHWEVGCRLQALAPWHRGSCSSQGASVSQLQPSLHGEVTIVPQHMCDSPDLSFPATCSLLRSLSHLYPCAHVTPAAGILSIPLPRLSLCDPLLCCVAAYLYCCAGLCEQPQFVGNFKSPQTLSPTQSLKWTCPALVSQPVGVSLIGQGPGLLLCCWFQAPLAMAPIPGLSLTWLASPSSHPGTEPSPNQGEKDQEKLWEWGHPCPSL